MTKCIGCKCCVVACNEQNGNPAAINWRRVGEIEGGHYPYTQRHHLSMGCNHCLEPSCLIGCPVEAYTKDPITGVVCTAPIPASAASTAPGTAPTACRSTTPSAAWSASATCATTGWPTAWRPPACSACPEGAIAIEIVNIAEWRARLSAARTRPACPPRTTASRPRASRCRRTCCPTPAASIPQRIAPEHPHWPLVFMLVLTQLSVGAFAVLWLLDMLGARRRGLCALRPGVAGARRHQPGSFDAASGSPDLRLARAAKVCGVVAEPRSSRRLSLFAGAASAFAGMLLSRSARSRRWPVLLTLHLRRRGRHLLGPHLHGAARPAWYSGYTLAEFFSTALLLGPLFVPCYGSLDARMDWIGSPVPAEPLSCSPRR